MKKTLTLVALLSVTTFSAMADELNTMTQEQAKIQTQTKLQTHDQVQVQTKIQSQMQNRIQTMQPQMGNRMQMHTSGGASRGR